MNANVDAMFAHVTLSKKNVTDLLAALEANHPTPSLQRMLPDGVFLKVTIETDEDHYKDGRQPGPGFVR